MELVAAQEIRLQRNSTENRLRNKASKRDIEASNTRLLNEDANYRLISNDGEIPFENYIRIDNSNLSPDMVAGMIKCKAIWWGLKTPTLTERSEVGQFTHRLKICSLREFDYCFA